MGDVFVLSLLNLGSLAAQLLAIVLVILTRQRPKPLLLVFWISAMVFSFLMSSVVLWIFRSKGTILGSNSYSVSPTVYLIIGVIALAAAAFAGTKRGRELIGQEIDRLSAQSDNEEEAETTDSFANRMHHRVSAARSRAEESLRRGSISMAIIVGFMMATPTPYSLLAVGHMVREELPLPIQLLQILMFSFITYIVAEIPIVSYLIAPESTSARVESFSAWLGVHKIGAVAALAAIVGIAMIIRGLSGLL